MYKTCHFDESKGHLQCVLRTSDNSIIPFDPANMDYQAYLKWLEEGNEPEPADEPQKTA